MQHCSVFDHRISEVNHERAAASLSTLLPEFTYSHSHAVVAGTATSGGLTTIDHAPNPVGQSILRSHPGNQGFPAILLKAAIIPTLIMLL